MRVVMRTVFNVDSLNTNLAKIKRTKRDVLGFQWQDIPSLPEDILVSLTMKGGKTAPGVPLVVTSVDLA